MLKATFFWNDQEMGQNNKIVEKWCYLFWEKIMLFLTSWGEDNNRCLNARENLYFGRMFVKVITMLSNN
jgi:hypothetical protein